MFICQECLERDYKNRVRDYFRRSFGRCEICEITNPCLDIHHSRLVKKDLVVKKSKEKKNQLDNIKEKIKKNFKKE